MNISIKFILLLTIVLFYSSIIRHLCLLSWLHLHLIQTDIDLFSTNRLNTNYISSKCVSINHPSIKYVSINNPSVKRSRALREEVLQNILR